MSRRIDRARQLLEAASSVVVVGHERPDGDSVGSMLALTLALTQQGKAAYAVSNSGIPSRFEFLPGANSVRKQPPDGDHLIVAVDTADAERLAIESPVDVAINIDHHPTNSEYAQVNLLYPEAAATTLVLHRLAPDLDLPLTPEVASNLLAGLITDTIGFRTPSVTAAVLRAAADLVEAGADLSSLYQRALIERSFLALRYWGAGLSTLQRKGELAWACLRLDERKRVGYPGEDDADLVEMLGTIREARVALIFVEQSEGRVKVSWRARGGVDVAELAASFGGGGHHLASGATVEGGLAEVVERVVSATRTALEGAAE